MPADPAKVIEMLKHTHLFKGLDEDKYQMVADLLEIEEHPANTTIFQQGDDSPYFYLIVSGRVRVSRYDGQTRQFKQLGMLEPDDYFGQEILENHWPREVTTEAVSDVVLARLNVPNFVAILELLPFLSKRLKMILDSYRQMLTTHFSWLDPDEMIHFIARRDFVILLSMLLTPALFGMLFIPISLFLYLNTPTSLALLGVLLAVIFVTLAWGIWAYIDWGNDYYIITSRRIVFRERVVLLYDSRHESPNESIQSTSTSTSQIGRILGYGNVAIRTFIGTILFRQVTTPDLIMTMIQEQQARAQSSQRQAELKAMEVSIERKINPLPAAPPPPKAVPPPTISPWQRFISDMFHLRYEMGGTILYRTHWFILLGKIWIPSLLLIGLSMIFILRASNQFTALSLQATCGLTGMLAVIVAGWWIYQYLDWHNDIYLITPDQIVDVNKKPLGRESRQSAPLKNILSIEYKRLGVIGLLLNFGTVYIRIGDQQLTFDDVYNPSEVQRELFHRLAQKNFSEKQSQAEGERQRMAEWIAAYHRVTQRNQPPRTPPSRGGF